MIFGRWYGAVKSVSEGIVKINFTEGWTVELLTNTSEEVLTRKIVCFSKTKVKLSGPDTARVVRVCRSTTSFGRNVRLPGKLIPWRLQQKLMMSQLNGLATK
jgi:hypothetical protein